MGVRGRLGDSAVSLGSGTGSTVGAGGRHTGHGRQSPRTTTGPHSHLLPSRLFTANMYEDPRAGRLGSQHRFPGHLLKERVRCENAWESGGILFPTKTML